MTVDLVRGALAVNRTFMVLGNERVVVDGATLIRNRSAAAIRDANHVTEIRASTPEEIGRLLGAVAREFDGCPHRRFGIDFETPPTFEPYLALEGGFERGDALALVLEGSLAGEAKRHDIRAVMEDAEWEAYAELRRLDWREYHEKTGRPYEGGPASQMIGVMRSKAPVARYWLAYVNGKPCAYCASFVGPNGFGLVEDLFTHPDFRHRGLATALIHHGVADCRARGAGPVAIFADPSDTPKNIYAAMGFRPIAVVRSYWKIVQA